ncbi:TlpA disulfide reductase family protein [Pedobacter sp. SYP-B3415]|uniref:TlpA family protein disulfide reductase n=1 Tax=Pedobacter sp. SYP-B3415 TaxID=2496641 RepID=UPI0013ECFE02|nr:TlpA disulfide reductase family protein [Pedobacter sp. SYP-B3415]
MTAKSQTNEYEQALAKFTGAKKYDIEKPGAMDGVAAPVFSAKTIAGKQIDLSKLQGKVVVLNFWFIACAPCRVEIPALNALVERFQNEDVLFVSIARENEEALKTHLQSTKFLFQTIADPETALSGKTFHVFGYPTTIVIDKYGKIRYYSLGGKITEEAVHKEFQAKLVPVIKECLNSN